MSENRPKEERQYQIMEAAMKVFVRKGYSDTRMNDIVEISGLSKGAIYHHFNSKRELFLALIDHWEIHTFPKLYTKVGNRSASDILRGFVNEIIYKFNNRRYTFLAELEFWALSNRDEEIRIRTRKLYEKILDLFEKVIRKGINSGEFHNISPKKSALFVLSSLQGIIWFTIFQHQEFTAEDYLKGVIESIIKGFNQNTMEIK